MINPAQFFSPSLDNKFRNNDSTRIFNPGQSLPMDQAKGQFNQIASSPLPDQSRDDFARFNAILQQAYHRLANFAPAQQDAYNPVEATTDKISSDQAAGNILRFIQQRLQSDAARGADAETLLKHLAEAEAGFIQGFNEARDQIQAMGLLTDELDEEIGATYDKVSGGIEALRQSLTGEGQVINSASRLQLSSQIRESRSFSLALTTQDGDQVTIQISRNQSASLSGSFSATEQGRELSIGAALSSSSAFSLQVEGELDQDELDAINNLLENVDAIATDFYAGNLERAFEQALTLELDPEELSSLNLELSQTRTSEAIAAYQSHSNEYLPQIPPLTSLLQRVGQLFEEASLFAEPLNLLEQIGEAVTTLPGGPSDLQSQASTGQAQDTPAELASTQSVEASQRFSEQLKQLLAHFFA